MLNNVSDSEEQLPVCVFQVPIQFEFEIEVTKSHPHFKIGPLRGIVPANGAAEVRFVDSLSLCSIPVAECPPKAACSMGLP